MKERTAEIGDLWWRFPDRDGEPFVGVLVSRITRQRVYFRGADDREHWVPLDELLRDGVAFTNGPSTFFARVYTSTARNRLGSRRSGTPFTADEIAAALAMLGVTPDATRAEIDAAYRRRARTAHPDAGGSVESFRALQEAYRRALVAVSPTTTSATSDGPRLLGDGAIGRAGAAALRAVGR